jgi:hypothetical protein
MRRSKAEHKSENGDHRRISVSAIGITFVLLFSLYAFEAVAQVATAPGIRMTVDRDPVVQGEPFTLSIKIETSSQSEPEIRLPHLSGFNILRQSESHPMSLRFSFGLGKGSQSHMQRQANYTFMLRADKPGKYKLAPVQVTLDGRKYRGKPFTIQVQRSGAAAPSGSLPGDQAYMDDEDSDRIALEGTKLDGAKVESDLFIQTHVSKKKLVVGEVLVMTIYLYTSMNIAEVKLLREPGTEGFWGENLVSAGRRFTTERVKVGGYDFDRAVLRKVALFPIKPGTLTIAPPVVELAISRGGFFSRPKKIKRSSLPVEVEVEELPEKNQPPGFNPANVGVYSFKTEVDTTEVKEGEPVTLTMTVQGDGNVRNLVLPAVEEIDGLKIYDPEEEVNIQLHDGLVTGTKTSRVLMIPKKSGDLVVPTISWAYFNTQLSRYRTLSGSSHTIRVNPVEAEGTQTVVGGSGTEPVQQKPGQNRLNRKLRSILSEANLEIGTDKTLLTSFWYIVLVLLAPFCYIVLIVLAKLRRKVAEDFEKGRSKRADSVALRRLSRLRSHANLSAEEFFKKLGGCLIAFLEMRLEAPVAGDTMAEVKKRLIQRGFSSEQAEKVAVEIESSDFARFSRSAGKEEERRQALSRMEQLIKELAKVRVLSPPKDGK